MEPGTDDESQMEAWLTEEGSQTRLVVEERGLPVDKLYLHGAGWQAHLEDLGRSLAEDAGAHPEAGRSSFGTGVAPALGRVVPRLRSDGDRVMSDEIRLSATTVNAPDALALAGSTPSSPAASRRGTSTG